MVAFLCTANWLELRSIAWFWAGTGEGPGLVAFVPEKLSDLLTFLEEMVMEEKPALFWGMMVVTAELACVREGSEALPVPYAGAVALTG